MYLVQPLRLQLQPYPAPGIYLRWLSPLGTWEGWLFAGDRDPKTDVAEASIVNTPDARTTVD